MLKTLLLLAIVIVGGMYVWPILNKQSQFDQHKEACINAGNKNDPVQDQANTDYCNCLYSGDSSTYKKSYADLTETLVRSCYIDFIQPLNAQACMAQQAANRQRGWNVDCNCYADRVTDTFILYRKDKKTGTFGPGFDADNYKNMQSCSTRIQ